MGTRYIIELELEFEQWYLRLKVDRNIEEEVILNNITEEGLVNALYDLLSRMKLELNDFQQKKILDDLLEETNHLLAQKSQSDNQSKGQSDSRQYVEKTETTNRQISHKQPQTMEKLTNERPGSGSYALQQRLISEYRKKLSNADRVEVKHIEINELKQSSDESKQLEALVRSHKEVQKTLRQLDERVAGLERLTTKLVEITELFLEA